MLSNYIDYSVIMINRGLYLCYNETIVNSPFWQYAPQSLPKQTSIYGFLALQGAAEVAIKTIPIMRIVILAGTGNTPKKFRKAAIRHNTIPGTNLSRYPRFWVAIVGPPLISRMIN